MKNPALLTSTVLLCCMAQVNASMMQYNTSNQMVRVDKQSILYGPKGYLASVDNTNILHEGNGAIIEQQESMVATTFGGVRLISNGVAQTIFTDNHSTLKTTSSGKNQRSYTDPYGNSMQKVTKESYPLEHNRLTFDGGYQINKDITNFNARSYISSLKVFSSMDSSNVANRYNFSDGNPIMKFDPSGHNAQKAFNILGVVVGISLGIVSGGVGFFSGISLATFLGGTSSGVGLAGLVTGSLATDYQNYNDNNPDATDKYSEKKIKDLNLITTLLGIVSLGLDISSLSVSYYNYYKIRKHSKYYESFKVKKDNKLFVNTKDTELSLSKSKYNEPPKNKMSLKKNKKDIKGIVTFSNNDNGLFINTTENEIFLSESKYEETLKNKTSLEKGNKFFTSSNKDNDLNIPRNNKVRTNVASIDEYSVKKSNLKLEKKRYREYKNNTQGGDTYDFESTKHKNISGDYKTWSYNK